MILLTGATGTIGGELVRLLANARIPIRVMTRHPHRVKAIGERRVDVVVGDLDDPASLRAPFENIEKLFLLTATNPRQVAQHTNAIAAAEQAGVSYVLKISALGASVDAPLRLTQWHGEADSALCESGIPNTILRPHWYMQNLLGSAPSIATTGAFSGNGGDGKFPAVDTRDIAAVAAHLLTHPGREGKIYDLTGPVPISYADMAAELARVLGRPVRYINLETDAMRSALIRDGVPEWLAADLVHLNEIFGAGRATTVSNAIAEITGRAARTFKQFAVDYADAFERPTQPVPPGRFSSRRP